jgi:hypothetical protein
MNSHLYEWSLFAFCTTVLAIYFGLPQPLGRAVAAVFWFLMLLCLIFRKQLDS